MRIVPAVASLLSLAFLAACSAGTNPGAEQAQREDANAAFVESLYDAFAQGDVETVVAGLAQDIRWTEAEGFPYAGTYTGPDAVLEEVFARLGSEWDGYTAAPEEFVADGDKVVVLGQYSGTYRETGRSFEAPFAHVWTVRDGEAVRFRQITDTELVQAALEPADAR